MAEPLRLACGIVVFIGWVILVIGRTALPEAVTTCDDPSFRTFDFWIGDWDVYDKEQPDKQVAHAVVEPILDRCVLHEAYEGADGHKGESFTIYDRSRHLWHQTWVTDHGVLLTIEGGFRDRAMVLEGADRAPDGKVRQVRGTWEAAQGGVREIAVRSTDGGLHWEPWFDLSFRPHTRSPHRLAAEHSDARGWLERLDQAGEGGMLRRRSAYAGLVAEFAKHGSIPAAP